MKRIISLILAILMLGVLCSCGKDSGKKERKRATAGMDTKTSSEQSNTENDTGILTALTESHAKSNKAGLVYDPNVLINLKDDKSSTVKIACVGDSITYGTLSSDPDKKSYPVQLQKLFSERFGNKYEIKNFGKAGAFVADLEGRSKSNYYFTTSAYKNMKKYKPDAVVIMIGTNDSSYFTSDSNISQFRKEFKTMIEEIKGLKSSPIIYVCTPLTRATAYSSTVPMETLRSVEISVANECGVYVVDTYNITKQYFDSYLYETDGLHPDDEGYDYLSRAIFDAVVNGLTTYVETPVSKTSDYVVYLDASKGTYNSVGATPDKPTSNFARAVELCRGGGTIVVCGPVTPATTRYNNIVRVAIAPENDYKITVTSIDPYNGTDYRKTNGAVIYMSASMYLNGDYEFKNVNFETVASGVKFVCNYNNVTMGSGISCTYSTGGNFVFIGGHDIISYLQSENDITLNKDCTINIKSGTYAYVRGGNFRTYSATAPTNNYNYGTIKNGVTYTLNITGGTFANTDSSNVNIESARLSSVLGANGSESGSKVICNISGGIFKGSLFAVSRMNPLKGSSVPTIAGDITLNITGGVFLGAQLDYLQTYAGCKNPKVTGAYALNVSGGSFASGGEKSVSAAGCQNATLKTSGTGANLEKWATVTGFKK